MIAAEILGPTARRDHAAAARRRLLRPARAEARRVRQRHGRDRERRARGYGRRWRGSNGGGPMPRPADLLFQDPAERQAARLLDDGRRPSVQAPPLPEHRRGHALSWRCSTRRSIRACSSGRKRPASTSAACSATCRRRCRTTASPSLYPQALDFVQRGDAPTAPSLQAALEKNDAAALALLISRRSSSRSQTDNGHDPRQSQVDGAEQDLDALQQALTLAQAAVQTSTAHRPSANTAEAFALTLQGTLAADLKAIIAAIYLIAGGVAAIPDFTARRGRFRRQPAADATDGGTNAGRRRRMPPAPRRRLADIARRSAPDVAITIGTWQHRKDRTGRSRQGGTDPDPADPGADRRPRRSRSRSPQQQIDQPREADRQPPEADRLPDRQVHRARTSTTGWSAGCRTRTSRATGSPTGCASRSSAATGTSSASTDSSFIQFGYWDSLHKGLLAGETLNHDLRRMQASYLRPERAPLRAQPLRVARGARSGRAADAARAPAPATSTCRNRCSTTTTPAITTAGCTRVSVTVVYPNPGKFDNVKAHADDDAQQGPARPTDARLRGEPPVGRGFALRLQLRRVPQKIVLGNAQDDPGLFLTAIASNIGDPRYLPFEGAGRDQLLASGAAGGDQRDRPRGRSDVVLHLYYTALDGGAALKDAVQQATISPTRRRRASRCSARQNDFRRHRDVTLTRTR